MISQWTVWTAIITTLVLIELVALAVNGAMHLP